MMATIVLLWLQLVGILVFMFGFFPLHKPAQGVASYPDDLPQQLDEATLMSQRHVGQLVILVIDALRADFVLPSQHLNALGLNYGGDNVKIKYLYNLLLEGHHHGGSQAYVAQAHAPTVTLPRVKALLSGTIPGFADVALNFGSPLFEGDNLVQQWHSQNRTLVMYGDDTWLKLFPENYFARRDGTTSFFVSDYTQVDDNVTRHLPAELARDDWDVCVLHYLGLDHIGHVQGPTGSNVPDKLEEMGRVVRLIHETLVFNKTWKMGLAPLIVVLGDHGMADAGGHGGSSMPEVMTPMVFLSPEIKARDRPRLVVGQPDLVPTLAKLTGVPIPRNNLGKLLPHVHDNNFLLYNAHQVSKLLNRKQRDEAGYSEYLKAQKTWTENGTSPQIYQLLQSSLDKMTASLTEDFAEYNMPPIISGIVIVALTLPLTSHQELWNGISGKSCLVLHTLHVLSLSSTSFIEEEHQTVYFFASTIVLLSLLKTCRSDKWATAKLALLLGLLRLARTWNQTGDKWAYLPDTGDWLKREENGGLLFVLHLSGLLWLWTSQVNITQLPDNVYVTLSYGLVALQRNQTSSQLPAQCVYLSFAIYLLLKFRQCSNVGQTSKVFLKGILPIIAMLGQPHNVILLPASLLAEQLLVPKNMLNYLVMGWTLYFQLGNGNSLASVDVGSAYVGITAFDPVIVSTLMAINTFAGPIVWMLLYMKRSNSNESDTRLFSALRAVQISSFLFICTVNRFHLFVWTVFSPKLLFMAMAVLTFNILYTVILTFCTINKVIFNS